MSSLVCGGHVALPLGRPHALGHKLRSHTEELSEYPGKVDRL